MFAPHAQAQTVVSIHDIMKASGTTDTCSASTTYFLPDSTYLYSHYGSAVSVTGVVVGVETTGDYTGTVYLSEPSSSWDNCVSTAEGMPVFNLKTVNAACAVVGASVTVVGDVVESTSIVAADVTAANTPGTGVNPTSCTVNSTGNTMTQSISVSSVLTTFGDALKYTGMTTSATFYAVAPAGGSLTESTETVTSTGQFWGTLSSNTATNNHLFRSAGIAGDEYVPSTAPSTVATWGGNPQRVLIDTTTFGGTPVNITVGQSITCTTGSGITVGATSGIGLIDYTLGYARLLIFPTSVCTVSGSVATTTSAAADSTHFHVGTLDLDRFYSTTGATTGSVAISASAYARRLNKAALAIVNSLGKPDILSVQEVQDLATLTDLATAVNTLGSAAYVPYLVQGNDPNSLNLGFLVNSSTVVVDSVTQDEASSTYTTTSGGSATLWERPPLVLQAEFVRTGKNYPVTVVNAHLTPRDNIGDTTLGPNIRAHRAAQATDMSALVQSLQTAGDNVILAGNLNAFEYSDGYVDVTGIIDGSPAASSAVTLYEPTSTTAALTDFITSVSSTSRYNYIERGDAVVYEHILASATVPDNSTASASLASYVSAVTQPHFTADFAAIDANDSTTPAGLTPHDGMVVSFLIPPAPTTASVSPTSINFGDVSIGGSASQTVTFTNTTTFTSTVNVTGIAISGTNAGDFTQTSSCTAVTEGQSCTITVTFTPTATGSRTATLTITNDSTSDPTLTVALSGIGVNTTATLTPASATFGSVYAGGGTSTAQVFTLTNTSTISIAVNSIALSSTNFTQTATTCGTTLAAGASCTISVEFTPTASGALTGTLTVTNSSTADPTLTASLSGTGLPTTATLTPASASYGNVIVASTSAAQVFTWTNTSSIALTIKSVAASGDYSVSATTCSGSIAANSSCTISVVFTPTALGTRAGTLTVVSTSSANTTLTSSLTGVGVADVEASATSLNFGNVDLGSTSAAQTVTITNYTNAAISLTSLVLSGSDYAYTTTCGSAIAGLSSCVINFTFTPTALGTRTGTLTVNTNDTKYPVITIALTGNGVDFAVAAAPTSGSIVAGFYETINLTLTPEGGFSAPVTISCASLASGSTCTPSSTTLTLSAATTVPVTITTTSQYTVIGYGGVGARGWTALLSGAAGLVLLFTRRRYRLGRLLPVVLLLAAAAMGTAGCGTAPAANSSPTAAGTYTYTLSVTDGTVTHSATYALTVTAK
ncbi:hypothetical protein SAMN05421819_2023 [Bryocella elongata]|uniref:Choice-of-anchor D domain-containing protein n=1 Tax=Bryocella elongata TaxID=863522 RepID=A0A1H5XYQ3_9BACT|nr:choice-of-anchor D domain-containing protein [Bryocella elongata]SEG16480.1 hypothetical protein SAMN05421819_2023 [Bryocella elongata]